MSDFFKTGDRMLIYPFRGRKSEITVNRTNYKIISSDKEDFSKKDLTLIIPTEVGISGSFELKLFKRCDGEDYYVFKTVENNDFFECNNSYVKEIVVSHGDEVRIGYNRLLFLPRKRNVTPERDSSFLLNPKIINSDLNILINGETGTGKTRLAKIIHERSGRRGRFVHLNLSSFSKNLLESEFFGHKKGAFTGAITDHPGAIFEAREGTLFLDEIDSLSVEQQKKLLLFLDSGKYRPVGSNGEKKSNCRFIFSSGQDLCHLVEEGVMRKDFYFRLVSEYSVFLPTLRESPEQIKSLISAFCLENDLVMTADLRKFYGDFNWPGNFRQLIGHLKKKKVLARTRRLFFDEADIELESSGGKSEISLSMINQKTFSNIKKEIFKQRLRYYDGKACLASESLGISRATLERAVKN